MNFGARIEDATGGITLIRGTFIIGRAPGCSLRLDSEAVSRRHALIQSQGGEHWLVDLGSTNGVYVSGRRVRLPTPLSDGDVLELAGYRLTFRCEEKAGAQDEDLVSTRRMHRTSSSVKTWLLLVDIEDSSKLIQQLPPKDFGVMVGKWFLDCRDLLDQCGSILHQYLGDGFLAYWPPQTKATPSVIDSIQRLQHLRQASTPPFRIVLHRGMVMIDSDMTAGQDRLFGADVYFLFRMEKVASKARWPLILSEAAAAELGAPTTPLGQSAVDGFDGVHPFFTM